MPTFYQEVEVEAEVYVDLEEFVDRCSESEKFDLLEILKGEDAYKLFIDEHYSSEWISAIEKLQRGEIQLSLEDIQTIKNIANKIV